MDNIRPLSTLTNLSPSQVIPNAVGAGVIPVGNYKGAPAFWDLDVAVNQPAVLAESLNILGILDGRLEGYDLRTLTVAALEAGVPPTVHSGTLIVPTGVVFFVNAVRMFIPNGTAGNTITGNWACSILTDGAGVVNQSFHAAAVTGLPTTQRDEFGPVANLFTTRNKPVVLRLPAGVIITFTVTNSVAPAAAAAVTANLQLRGYVGKALVR